MKKVYIIWESYKSRVNLPGFEEHDDFGEDLIGIAKDVKEAEKLCEQKRERTYQLHRKLSSDIEDMQFYNDETEGGYPSYRLVINWPEDYIEENTWYIEPHDVIGS